MKTEQDAESVAPQSELLCIPDTIPAVAEDDGAEDPFLTELMEFMSRPLCPECSKLRWDRLPSPLWHCPHRPELIDGAVPTNPRGISSKLVGGPKHNDGSEGDA